MRDRGHNRCTKHAKESLEIACAQSRCIAGTIGMSNPSVPSLHGIQSVYVVAAGEITRFLILYKVEGSVSGCAKIL